ncbi:MAG TPA: glycosyltransferase family 39 protein [Candidatus Kapabacteria bacterium]|nr:glycosyltransferase family 39 protein [Candidatus Kapabacteria bacterium]
MIKASIIAKYLVWALVALLLLMMLPFPFGHDQALFEAGGAAIARDGAVPFRDFLDMKQPLIFYIYSFGIMVFGRSEWGPRAVDAAYHLISLFLYYLLLRSVYKNEKIALGSVLLYTAYYCGTGFWMSATTESFAFLPTIAIAFAVTRVTSDSKSRLITYSALITIAIIILTGLKVTFALSLIAIFIYGITQFFFGKRYYLRFLTLLGLFLIVGFSLVFYWLWNTDSLANTILNIEWINRYASYYPLWSTDTFRLFYAKIFPQELLLTITPAFITLAIIAIVTKPIVLSNSLQTDRESGFRFFCLLCTIIGLLGIAIERKGFNYHYTRIAWCVIPFVAEGGRLLVAKWKIDVAAFFRHRTIVHGIKILFVLSAILAILLFSPIPRIMDQGFTWSLLTLQNDEFYKQQKLGRSKYSLTELDTLVRRYKPQMTSSDNIFLWGNTAQLYLAFDKTPKTLCLVNPQFVSPTTPPQWRDKLLSDLAVSRPRFFFCEYGDARPLISGYSGDSYQALLEFHGLRKYLSNYTLIDSTIHFKVYRRL